MIINMNGAKAPETPSPTLQEKTVTPETLPTVIGADEGYDGLSQVTVNPDAQLKAENIRSGKTVFGVEGSFVGEPQYSGDSSILIEEIVPTSSNRPPIYTFGDLIDGENILPDDVSNFYGRSTYKYCYRYIIDGLPVDLIYNEQDQGFKYSYAFKAFVPSRTITYTSTIAGSSDYSKIEAHIEYYFNAGLANSNSSYSAQTSGNLLYPLKDSFHEEVFILEGEVGQNKQFTLTNTVPDGYLGMTASGTLTKGYPFYIYGFRKVWFKPLE